MKYRFFVSGKRLRNVCYVCRDCAILKTAEKRVLNVLNFHTKSQVIDDVLVYNKFV